MHFFHYLLNYTIARTIYTLLFTAGPIAWVVCAAALALLVIYFRGLTRRRRPE